MKEAFTENFSVVLDSVSLFFRIVQRYNVAAVQVDIIAKRQCCQRGGDRCRENGNDNETYQNPKEGEDTSDERFWGTITVSDCCHGDESPPESFP